MLQLGMLGLVFLCGVILVAVRSQRVESFGVGKAAYTAMLKRFQKVGSWTDISSVVCLR